MTALFSGENYEVSLQRMDAASKTNWAVCHLKLNALSFGYATNTFWEFWVHYCPNFARWNFEKPRLPTYYETPRSVLPKDIPSDVEIAPDMKGGYSSKTMQEYEDPNFPDGYYKLAWDYPCPHISPDVKYVHPQVNRVLTVEELESLYGCHFGEIPERIVAYIGRHVNFYLNQAWGEQNFDGWYDKFAGQFKLTHYRLTPFIKTFDFRQYTPALVCMVSDRYPMAR